MSSPDFQPGEIIIFTPFIRALGGVERLMLGLSKALHADGRLHRIACFEDAIDLASHATGPMRVDRIRAKRNPWFEACALRSFLACAHRMGAAPPLLFDQKSAFYAGIAELPPFFLHYTDPPSLLPSDISKNAISARRAYPPFKREERAGLGRTIQGEIVHRLNRRGVRHAQMIMAMTDRIGNELELLYGVRARIVRPGVPAQAASPCGEDRTLNFLSVSRLAPNKRIDWILRALRKLEDGDEKLSHKADWCLQVVGDGPERCALEQLASVLALDARVNFHGLVSDDRLEELYGTANLFLMPAVQGYGLPALEALERRVPVILHRESGVAEILGGSPWVQIIDSEYDLPDALVSMVARLQGDELDAETLPSYPSESDWARRIAQSCGWQCAPD